ncbi:MAG: M56 family metallopeptidase, partial [Clostridia bacterium]|nr:M56 family metallopeptidase [Clostridia bacterium]
LRLMLPFSVQTDKSVIPNRAEITRGVESALSGTVDTRVYEPVRQSAAQTQTGVPVSPPAQQGESGAEAEQNHASSPLAAADIAGMIWAAGAGAFAVYTLASYLRLRRTVKASIEISEGVYACDYITASFATGLIKPKIYVPSALSAENMQYVIEHERSHIRRRDIPAKLLGHMLLAVYWFNPLAWISYILFCRDIEFACDERTVKNYGKSEKAGYAQTLLDCKLHRGAAMSYPVAFGDTAIKERVKKVLNYKKPAVWITAVCLVLCAALTACVLTEARDSHTSKYVTGGYSAAQIREEYNAIKPENYENLTGGQKKEYNAKLVELLAKIAGGDKEQADEYAALLREITGYRYYDLDSNPGDVFYDAMRTAEMTDLQITEGESALGLRGVKYDKDKNAVTLEQFGLTRYDYRNLPYESGIMKNDGTIDAADKSPGKYRVEIMLLSNTFNCTVSGKFANEYKPDTDYDLPGGEGKLKMRYAVVDNKLIMLYIGSDEPISAKGIGLYETDESGIKYIRNKDRSFLDPFVVELTTPERILSSLYYGSSSDHSLHVDEFLAAVESGGVHVKDGLQMLYPDSFDRIANVTPPAISDADPDIEVFWVPGKSCYYIKNKNVVSSTGTLPGSMGASFLWDYDGNGVKDFAFIYIGGSGTTCLYLVVHDLCDFSTKYNFASGYMINSGFPVAEIDYDGEKVYIDGKELTYSDGEFVLS